MLTRTEEQKVLKAPIVMLFGEKKYEVKPLTLTPARLWREKLNEAMAPIADSFQQSSGLVSRGLAQALLQFPEKMLELICAYSPELDRKTIEENATEEQLVTAWSDLMVVAYPFLAPLVMVMRNIQPTQSQ